MAPAAKVDAPGHRHVRIAEPWANHDVASEIAKPIDGQEDRCVEPPVDIADHLDRPGDIGPQRVYDAIHCAVTSHDVDRVTALQLHDCGHLPTLAEPVAAARQVVDRVGDEAVARIEIR